MHNHGNYPIQFQQKHSKQECQPKENSQCENESIGRAQRNRRPAASKEVVTLSERVLNNGRDNLPGWLVYAKDYLNDEVLGSERKSCVGAWMAFESSLPSESSAVRRQENSTSEI